VECGVWGRWVDGLMRGRRAALYIPIHQKSKTKQEGGPRLSLVLKFSKPSENVQMGHDEKKQRNVGSVGCATGTGRGRRLVMRDQLVGGG
jgi:hypothetical protein